MLPGGETLENIKGLQMTGTALCPSDTVTATAVASAYARRFVFGVGTRIFLLFIMNRFREKFCRRKFEVTMFMENSICFGYTEIIQ